jgi:hypothetical protein
MYRESDEKPRMKDEGKRMNKRKRFRLHPSYSSWRFSAAASTWPFGLRRILE